MPLRAPSMDSPVFLSPPLFSRPPFVAVPCAYCETLCHGRVQARCRTKHYRRQGHDEKKGLASLVNVEGVCIVCVFVEVSHPQKDWIRRRLIYGAVVSVFKGGGSWASVRALHAYHSDESCDLPVNWKVRLGRRLSRNF